MDSFLLQILDLDELMILLDSLERYDIGLENYDVYPKFSKYPRKKVSNEKKHINVMINTIEKAIQQKKLNGGRLYGGNEIFRAYNPYDFYRYYM